MPARENTHVLIRVQGGDGSRQPSDLEVELATIQGEEFGKIVAKAST